jgi:uncharacterized protein (DUF433 family)
MPEVRRSELLVGGPDTDRKRRLRRSHFTHRSQGVSSATFELMHFPEWIEARSDVMMGKPCLKGTRIPVYLILEKLAAGETSEILLAAYPQLRTEHIKASLEYAARLAADEVILANQ